MERDETLDRITVLDLCIFFIENLYLFTQSLVRQTIHTIDKGIRNLRVAELFDAINDRLSVHPPLRFLVFATAFSCVIPVAMFVIFGITSTVITFAGFLFIEGTLLAVGAFCMLMCIATLLLVLSAFAAILGVIYLLALKLGYALNSFEVNSSKILKTLPSSLAEGKRVQIGNMIADAHQD